MTAAGDPQTGGRAGEPALVTFGEAMGVVASTEPGPLAVGGAARLSFAGAEATVAIGVSRLGHRAAWVGRVGDDAVGAMVLSGLRGEGVDISGARVEPDVPTGLMLRERRTADRTRVAYYRRDLAGSRLSPADVDAEVIAQARVLHLTGITPALSDTALAAVRETVRVAKAAGVAVSIDVNYRALLWARTAASAVLGSLVPQADIVFAGPEEASLLVAEDEPERMARALGALGPATTVLKLGAEGALVHAGGEVLVQSAFPVTCVDPIGAGDAFVAGYLAGTLDGSDAARCLRLAAACGAFAVSAAGDWEGLPRRGDLRLLDAADVSR
ncbi:2-dehydro-3-deoxygluconokinase [Actinokineospora alba]|uniref:2-dehydro-3-deoxygluconokinase n=1 Tax=Actinokineospora alba TaxID=504798 RepID=A0A1H0EWF0_9PSEU|nr:sugar kinase [Actinokineospora alba]TDP69250.1 2-dehydro-3-deoxygluconokinase [Actinokineospora alba]SDI20989.1 2-dehydro-3-deoxygluconokinase [Actinokineospora alba]SDN86714.1 2-dehydro-3-deoxygluconokinase [Actinokineospora alba]